MFTDKCLLSVAAMAAVIVAFHSPLCGESLVIPQQITCIGIDAEVYRLAGLRWVNGEDVYADPLYIYPPLFAWIVSLLPLAEDAYYSTYRWLSHLVFVLTPVMVLFPFRRALENAPTRESAGVVVSVITLTTLIGPARSSYEMGNVDHFVLFGVITSYALYRAKWIALSGVLLGVLTTIKVMPGVVVLLFASGVLFTRRENNEQARRDALMFVVVAALTSGVTLLAWPQKLVAFYDHYHHVESDYRYASMSSLLSRVPWISGEIAPKLNLLMGGVLAVLWGGAAAKRQRPLETLWVPGGLLVFFSNPRGNDYTLMYLLLPLTVLFFSIRTKTTRALIASGLVAAIVLGNTVNFGTTVALIAVPTMHFVVLSVGFWYAFTCERGQLGRSTTAAFLRPSGDRPARQCERA